MNEPSSQEFSMRVLRTPDERFDRLPDYPFAPHYVDVGGGSGDALRMHYLDEGDPDASAVVLVHGEPTWSYLYRWSVPTLVDAGLRVIAPDLVGFGRSDKPAEPSDYTYERHVGWLRDFLDAVGLTGFTLVGHDWGGLLGLRIVAAEPGRVTGYVASNHGFPSGDVPPNAAFLDWQRLSQTIDVFDVGAIVDRACASELADDVIAAYDAPYPDEEHKAGARQFPILVPTRPDDPSSAAVRTAREALASWHRPFLTVFGADDPISKGADTMFQGLVPGAAGPAHAVLPGGHNLPEDAGEPFGRLVAEFASAAAKTST